VTPLPVAGLEFDLFSGQPGPDQCASKPVESFLPGAPAAGQIGMDRGRQAAGACHGIERDFGARFRDRVLRAVETHQVHAIDRVPPMSRANAVADPHIDARGARAEQPAYRDRKQHDGDSPHQSSRLHDPRSWRDKTKNFVIEQRRLPLHCELPAPAMPAPFARQLPQVCGMLPALQGALYSRVQLPADEQSTENNTS